MSISLAGFFSFATQMPNQLIKLTAWSRALLQTQIVTQINNKTPPPITELPNFNFNFNPCTTFTHFHNEPEAKQETKAIERHFYTLAS
jgi:hypothetical protein